MGKPAICIGENKGAELLVFSRTGSIIDIFNAAVVIISATRVMIFSQYRDSVQEITDMLNVHRPLVKVMSFIGQSSAGKATKGFTQKEQLQVCVETVSTVAKVCYKNMPMQY